MGVSFKPCPNGVGVKLISSRSVAEVSACGEGGGEGIVVRFKVVGRMNLVA